MALKKPRARYSKSTSGCSTCKIRRVKCDEASPQCLRCVSTGRKCDGPRRTHVTFVEEGKAQLPNAAVIQTLAISEIPQPLNQLPWLERLQERQQFVRYVQQAAPILSGRLDHDLWSYLVPRLAEADLTVRYALFAIASFFENPVQTVRNGQQAVVPISSRHAKGLRWHAQALSLNRQHSALAEWNTTLLLTGALLSCLEFQQNNYMAGLRMIKVLYMMSASVLTAGCQNGYSRWQDERARIILPMLLRCAPMLFSSYSDLGVQISPDESKTDSELGIFAMLNTIYAFLKDIYMVLGSSKPGQRVQLGSLQLEYSSRLDQLELGINELRMTSCDIDTKLAALGDYCAICRSWLALCKSALNADGLSCKAFLDDVFRHAELISEIAHVSFPNAHRTIFFHDIVICPTAYLVSVFALDEERKEDALALSHRRTHTITPHAQLHAIVISTQYGSFVSSKVPTTGVYRITERGVPSISGTLDPLTPGEV